MLTWKRFLLCAVAGAALAAPARSQAFGIGATYGSVNDISHSFSFDGFKPSEYTIFGEYHFEKESLLRLTYGSMWTEQAQSGMTINGFYVPAAKERINYFTGDASYVFGEDYYLGGFFGGVGAYNFNPQPMPPEAAAYQDLDQTVFGINLGVDGEFRVLKNLSIVLRLTYHNVWANPHRQFFNADAGLVAKF